MTRRGVFIELMQHWVDLNQCRWSVLILCELLCITAEFLDQINICLAIFYPLVQGNSANILSAQPNDLTFISGNELDGAGWQPRRLASQWLQFETALSTFIRGKPLDILMRSPLLFLEMKTRYFFWQEVVTSPAIVVAIQPGVFNVTLGQTWSIPNHSNKVLFVPKPNKSIFTVCVINYQ